MQKHETEQSAALAAQNLHIAEIAATLEKSEGGVLIARSEHIKSNPLLEQAVALYSKNYTILV